MKRISQNAIITKLMIDYILLFYIILLISSTTTFSYSTIQLYIGFSSVLGIYIYLFRNNVHKFLYYIVFVWIFINVISGILIGSSFNLNLVIGYLIRIVLAYMVLRIIGHSFWIKYEKLIFLLTFLSLIIFTINLMIPQAFINLTNVFQPITAKIFTERYPFYWTSIIFTHSSIANSSNSINIATLRNAGFMWEPGAFAMIIAIAILINWYSRGFILSKRIVVYVLAMITTFSTAGYLCLAILGIIYILKSKSYFAWLILFVFLLFGLRPILNLDFIAPKVNQYISGYNQNVAGYDNYKKVYEVNRYSAFILKLNQWSKFPIGYGVVADKEVKGTVFRVDGVNGIGDLLVRWGIIGIIFFLISVRKYFIFLNPYCCNKNSLIIYLSMLVVLVVFYSNPIELNPILFLLILTPFTFSIIHPRNIIVQS